MQQSSALDWALLETLAIDCLLYLVKAVVFVYDLVSQPYYYYKDQVYKRRHEVEEVKRSCQVNVSDPQSAWRQVEIDERQREIETRIDSFVTYDEMMRSAFAARPDSPCYAYREVLEERWTKRPDSDKQLRQVRLSEYKWVSYGQFERQIEAARRGFLLEGIRAGHRVMLYADTRAEWQIATQALIRMGAVVGTMYSTLGQDGIVHSINETEVSHVITQRDKVNRLLRLKSKLPKLAKIIYFEPNIRLPASLGGPPGARGVSEAEFECPPGVECISFTELVERALEAAESKPLVELERANRDECAARLKDSIAVIMYTSGSTGIPKGVLISHRNMMATIKSFSYVTKDFVHRPAENVATAYLPLAHIFEFCIESMLLFHGVRFGFATPHTLTDKSPGLVAGEQGDLGLLQPTVTIIVPLILDRIVQGVRQALAGQSYFKQQLVTYLIKYKIYWQRRHYETPLVDRLVCSKIAMALGGRAKYVICGSAPLSGETQSFVRAALNLKLPQGFGTTETCAATACQLFDDQSTGNVGLPVSGCQVKLEAWLEGNYRPTDRPNPRGEIVVGGEMVAHGYFKLDEATREAFYEDARGIRWYRTGDIGEFLPNGNLKIIDRKKDLVKLQNGEYISLGKVESTLKCNPYLDNFCVYADSSANFVVALGPANEAALRALAQQVLDEAGRISPAAAARNERRRAELRLSGAEEAALLDELREVLASYESDELNNNGLESAGRAERKMSTLSTGSCDPASCVDVRLERLCENWLIESRVMDYIRWLGDERNLMSVEVPKKLLLLAEPWTEDKNLVTAAMKIRRNFIYKRYEEQLAKLYEAAGRQSNGRHQR